MAESFVFYDSYFEAMRQAPQKARLELLEAVCRYGLRGEKIELSTRAARMAFALIEPTIDSNRRRREAGKKGAAFGALGGRPKKAEAFCAPEREDVQRYFQEMGCREEAMRFFDFYAAKGWTVGSAPMADWKAAARRWKADTPRGGKPNAARDYEQRTYEETDFEKLLVDFDEKA